MTQHTRAIRGRMALPAQLIAGGSRQVQAEMTWNSTAWLGCLQQWEGCACWEVVDAEIWREG